MQTSASHILKYTIQEAQPLPNNLFVRKPKILLVEDTPVIQHVHSKFLQIIGCDIDVAVNGYAAIKKCSERFDLIFMDLGLPDISGYEASATIRKFAIHKNTPIVVLTSYGDEVVDDCIIAGINEVVSKPIPIDGMRDVLLRWLAPLVIQN